MRLFSVLDRKGTPVKTKRMLPLAGSLLLLTCLAAALTGCRGTLFLGPFHWDLASGPTPTVQPTYTVLPTYTPRSTYTPLPTYTFLPTYTDLPTLTATP